MFIAQLIIFTITLILHGLRKTSKGNAFIKSPRAKNVIHVAYVANLSISSIVIAMFLIAPIGLLIDYIGKGRHLNSDNHPIAYTLGHLEEADFRSSRSGSYYIGTFRFQIGTEFYTMEDKMDDDYRDYIYILKVNLENPKHADTIPILLEDIPQNTVFYMQNIYVSNDYIAYPVDTKAIESNLQTIETNDIISFELKSDNLNLIELPLNGWRELPVIATGNKQKRAKYITYVIRTASLLTSLYSLGMIFMSFFTNTQASRARRRSRKDKVKSTNNRME